MEYREKLHISIIDEGTGIDESILHKIGKKGFTHNKRATALASILPERILSHGGAAYSFRTATMSLAQKSILFCRLETEGSKG